jgi:hypothetical protein
MVFMEKVAWYTLSHTDPFTAAREHGDEIGVEQEPEDHPGRVKEDLDKHCFYVTFKDDEPCVDLIMRNKGDEVECFIDHIFMIACTDMYCQIY